MHRTATAAPKMVQAYGVRAITHQNPFRDVCTEYERKKRGWGRGEAWAVGCGVWGVGRGTWDVEKPQRDRADEPDPISKRDN